MKIRLADYVAQFLVDNNITHGFTVTGGGAMHLNDALGHQKGLTMVYNHHEQACAIAAESYARINNEIAVVCVTTGPGGTNAITGVVGGWLDSIPMLVISGQVRYDTTARSTGLDIRAMGDQEFDITKAVASMTKYCEMIEDPKRIAYALEKSLYLACTGRPGPCWIDIPVNFQGCTIDTDELIHFDKDEYERENADKIAPHVTDGTVDAILEKIAAAKRPVLYAGNGIRISGGFEAFEELVDKLNIPVVTCWDSIDAIYDEHPLYTGRGGIMGDRAGNFAVQNSDLVFAVGNRLSIRQVGYNWTTWAREAYVIVNDVDRDEIKKPTLHVDMPVWADAKELLEKMNARLDAKGYRADSGRRFWNGEEWLERCTDWKKKYPVVLPKHYEDTNHTNVYVFIKELSSRLAQGQVTVVGNGSACVVGSHAYVIKKNQRFIINSAIASMGYDLPAAIGACVAHHGNAALHGRSLARQEQEPAGEDTKKDIICISGDGSIQMNLQELQTIIHHKMPIKIFMINNEGYHSIRQTQTNLFNKNFVGIGPQSEDLSFPDMGKIAAAYGYPYFSCDSNEQLAGVLDEALSMEGPVFVEIFVSKEQNFEPKSSTRRLEDGTLISPPLEDLGPFLDREEFYDNMIIKPIS